MPDEYMKSGDTLGAVVRNEKTGKKSVAVDLYLHFDALLKKGSVDLEVARHVHQLRHLCNEALKDRAKLMGQVRMLKKRDIPRLEEQLAVREVTIADLRVLVEALRKENTALTAGPGSEFEVEYGETEDEQ